MNGYHSNNYLLKHGVPQGSILGLLLFLIFINDLNRAVKHSVVHHFADDTNLIFSHKSPKIINKKINHDLRLIIQWLRANKISLNASKTEIVIFRTKSTNLNRNYNFRVNGQKINPVNQVKYLGLYLDEHLSWNVHLNQLKPKLFRANGILTKLRYYVQRTTLKSIHAALFN